MIGAAGGALPCCELQFCVRPCNPFHEMPGANAVIVLHVCVRGKWWIFSGCGWRAFPAPGRRRLEHAGWAGMRSAQRADVNERRFRHRASTSGLKTTRKWVDPWKRRYGFFAIGGRGGACQPVSARLASFGQRRAASNRARWSASCGLMP